MLSSRRHSSLEQSMGLSSSDGKEERMVVCDSAWTSRQLNAATIKDAHHLPRIDDLLDALHGV